MKRIVVISSCSECPHFDNQYYGYHEMCKELDKKIEKQNGDFIIPDECPLQKLENN